MPKTGPRTSFRISLRFIVAEIRFLSVLIDGLGGGGGVLKLADALADGDAELSERDKDAELQLSERGIIVEVEAALSERNNSAEALLSERDKDAKALLSERGKDTEAGLSDCMSCLSFCRPADVKEATKRSNASSFKLPSFSCNKDMTKI